MSDQPNTDERGGSSFEAYFKDQDEESSLTIHEDGRLVITGVLTGEEALRLLYQAAHNVEVFIRRRALPATIEALAPDDPAAGQPRIDDIPF